MERGFVDLAVALIRNLSVFMLLAYFLTRIPAFGDILSRRYSWNNRVLLTILFGILLEVQLKRPLEPFRMKLSAPE